MFQRAYELRNTIQTYAWGSLTAIAELLGGPCPSATPQAELWMGAHPKAPSEICTDDEGWQPLDRLIERLPDPILGPGVAERFGPQLPYLFKVLAAAQPLSIQAHPDRRQALEGFARENRAGVPLDADRRNYRDENHKPELFCALSDFWALNGFRPFREIQTHMRGLCPEGLGDLLALLDGKADDGGIGRFFAQLMHLGGKRRQRVLDEAVTRARQREGEGDICRWVARLGRRYPDDIGVLAPAMLNLVHLQPAEAMFLPSGQMHAYLEGTGIEVMANSDNVLRGGLTPKHVDVTELMRVLRFEGRAPVILTAETVAPGQRRFRTAAEEFELSVLRVGAGRAWQSPHRRWVETLLCTEGGGHLTVASGQALGFKKGKSLLVPAAAGAYRIEGTAVLYRVALPDEGL